MLVFEILDDYSLKLLGDGKIRNSNLLNLVFRFEICVTNNFIFFKLVNLLDSSSLYLLKSIYIDYDIIYTLYTNKLYKNL